jgi:hypothetical protein
MKKIILLIFISISIIGCEKEISFETVDDGIDGDIVKYDLVNYKIVKTIKNDEFYKIWIQDLEKSKSTEAQKELADSLKEFLNSKEFNKNEIITVIEFTSKINGFLYNQIGYFDKEIKMSHKKDLEPSKMIL